MERSVGELDMSSVLKNSKSFGHDAIFDSYRHIKILALLNDGKQCRCSLKEMIISYVWQDNKSFGVNWGYRETHLHVREYDINIKQC